MPQQDPLPAAQSGANASRLPQLALLAGVAVFTALVFAPTTRSGFLRLAFDDGLILDNPDILSLSWAGVLRIFTTFREANYIPLTTLTFAIDHHFVGFDPLRYHVVNILLHSINAALVWIFLRPLLRSNAAATLGALIFAVHPLQLEAVTLAVQRKTLLSGAFFLLTFIFYQRFFATEQRRYYVAALAAFALSVLAKPITVPLPVALLLYEHHFVRNRPRLLEKIPLFVIALLGSWVALAASHEVAAVKAPHGGDWISHTLMVSRVSLEYVAALFLPANLSPIYYYRTGTQYEAINFIAFFAILFTYAVVFLQRRRRPWTFFCLGWFTILLLPQSNIIPLAQLRPDRYVYLSIIGFGLWVAAGFDIAVQRRPDRAVALRLAATVGIGLLAVTTSTLAPIWRNDVSAWTRVVERHPWCGIAHHLLGVAYLDAGDPVRASAILEEGLRLNADMTDTRYYLARSYQQLGRRELALQMARSFAAAAPDDERGRTLLNDLQAVPGPG